MIDPFDFVFEHPLLTIAIGGFAALKVLDSNNYSSTSQLTSASRITPIPTRDNRLVHLDTLKGAVNEVREDCTFWHVLGAVLLSAISGTSVATAVWLYKRTKKLNEEVSSLKQSICEVKADQETLPLELQIQSDKSFTKFHKQYQKQIGQDGERLEKYVDHGIKRVETCVRSAYDQIELVKRAFLDLIETDDKLLNMTNRMEDLSQSVSRLDNDITTRYKQMRDQARDLNSKIHKYIDETDEAKIDLEKCLDIQKLNAYKGQLALVNSEVLFDAALSKFEVIENGIKNILGTMSVDGEEEMSTDEEFADGKKRLEKCLELAIENRRRLEFLGCKRDAELSSSSELSQILVDHSFELTSISTPPEEEKSAFEYFRIYSDATDLALADLNERMGKMEMETTGPTGAEQKPLPKDHPVSMVEERTFFVKNLSPWLSGLYGLLNARTHCLELQILDEDQMDGLRTLQQTCTNVKEEYGFLTEMVESCKKSCASLMEKVYLIVLESHLINNTNDAQIIEICHAKIKAGLDEQFQWFDVTISKVETMKKDKAEQLTEILSHFKDKLESDLSSTATELVARFRENVQDFYVIQNTLKEMELSPESSQMSISENDFSDSILSSTPSSSYKPLKLLEKRRTGRR